MSLFQPQALKGSFHLPLHRHLAMFINAAVQYHGLALRDVLPPPDKIQMIMMHPLQLQVGLTQICH